MGFTERQYEDEIDGDGDMLPAVGLLAFRGPLIPITIELPEDVRRSLERSGTRVAPPTEGLALIDTGAMTTIVDESVCLQIGAREVAPSPTHRSLHPTSTLFFAVKIGFEAGWLPGILYPAIASADLGFGSSGSRLLCIFGRDFLADKMMIYNGRRGRFELHK